MMTQDSLLQTGLPPSSEAPESGSIPPTSHTQNTSDERYMLNERQMEILYYLHTYHYFTCTQLSRLIFEPLGMTRHAAAKSLQRMIQKGLISHHRPPLSPRGFSDSYYYITKSGYTHLKQAYSREAIEEKFVYRGVPMEPKSIKHRYLCLDAVVALLRDSECEENFDLIHLIPEWKPKEHMVLRTNDKQTRVQAQEITVKPDLTAIFHYYPKQKNVLFFIEIDAGTIPIQSRMFWRMKKYQKVFGDKTSFARASPLLSEFTDARVLTITTTESRAKYMAQHIKVKEAFRNTFLYAHADSMITTGIIKGRYYKSGYEGLCKVNSEPADTDQ